MKISKKLKRIASLLSVGVLILALTGCTAESNADNEIIKVGYRVKVPFRTRLVEGFIVGLKCDLNEPIKSIKKIITLDIKLLIINIKLYRQYHER